METGALVATVFVGTLIEAVLGFGFAPIFVPVAALIVAPRHAVAMSLILGTVMGSGLYVEHRPRASLRSIGPLVAGALIGTPLGILILLRVDETVLRLLVAAAVFVSAAATLASRSAHDTPARLDLPVRQGIVGLIGGVVRGAISMGGPPVVLYQHWVGGGSERIRGRLYAYFFWLGVPATLMAVPTGLFTEQVIRDSAVALPALAAGILLGRVLRPRLAERWFGLLSMLLLAVTSAFAAWGAGRVLLG